MVLPNEPAITEEKIELVKQIEINNQNEEVVVRCDCSEEDHSGWKQLDIELNFSVEQLYENLLTDCPFSLNFRQMNKKMFGKFFKLFFIFIYSN